MEMQISNRRNLVMAADDFGISERANRNILFLISMGKIDRVAVLADGTVSENEIRELIRSGVKLDVHLELSSSAGADHKIPALHLRLGNFLLNYLSGTYRQAKVREDWQSQIEKFHSLFGKYPDGINSHEHVHFFPPFFRIILSLQEKYPIPYLRFASDSVLAKKSSIGRILALLRKLNLKRFEGSAFTTSNHLVSLDWIADIDGFLDDLETGTTEVVCHPQRAEEFVLIKNKF